jgi:hypothetical protein
MFNFYIHWFLDSHGINTFYSLHKDFWDFIKQPYIGSHPIYFVALLNLFLAGTGVYSLTRLWRYLKRIITLIKQKQLFNKLTLNLNTTNFYLLSVLLGLGIFMNFGGIFVRQYYLIVAFPFTYIFIAKIYGNKKKLLNAIIFAQLFLTISFLVYIHTHDGAKNGDYGVTYCAQMQKFSGH